MSYRRTLLVLSTAVVGSATFALAEPRLSAPVAVFTGGGGYPNFRTPSITAMPDGSLLAIAEGRTFDDPGIGESDLDIISRRSLDGGMTWGPIQIVDTWAGGANSNPTTVLDSSTGRMFVLFNRWEGFLGTSDSLPGTTNNSAWMRYSDDNGASWSTPANITASVKDYNNWNSVAFGPGSGIQASNGRLMIPSARWANGWASYAVYSSDHGQTWTRGQLLPGGNLSNENQLVQLADGRIHMEARANTAGDAARVTSKSSNGGLTWSLTSPGQVSPSVHAAVERLSLQSASGEINRILYTGPKGPDRTNLVVRTSYDETLSYVNERLLYDGYSGYSDITIMQDGSIGVLFETGEARNLTFLKLNREWIEPPQRLSSLESFRYNQSTVPNLNGGLLWNAGWTANPDLTGASTAKVRNADLNYTAFPFTNESQRSAFFDNGGSLSRPLPSAIDLGGTGVQYFSLLVQQNDTGTDVETSLAALDISLYAGAVKTASYGVRGNEAVYFDLPGASGETASNTIDKNVAYYLVAKIVPQTSGPDQIYVKAFRSGDSVPAVDDGLGWTLAGNAGVGSSSVLDRIVIKGGSQADWIIDELRSGTSFGAVVSNVLRNEWTADADGSWLQNSNWFDGAPSGGGSHASFGPAITAPRTVTLDVSRQVGSISFTSPTAYRIAGAGTLVLGSTGAASAIDVSAGSHEIATTVQYQSSVTINVAAGAALTTSGGASTVNNAALNKTGQGTLNARTLRFDAVNIDDGVAAVLPGGGPGVAVRTKLIDLGPDAALDLNDAKVVVDYTGTSPLATLEAWVLSGRAGGAWNGVGIRSTTAGEDPRYAIGIAEASELGVSMFAGETVDGTTVLLRQTLLGDSNLTGSVDLDDFTLLAANFGQSGGWSRGDFDYSGTINLDDFTGLAANFGQVMPTAIRAVPEPTFAVGCLAAMLLLRRRRYSASAMLPSTVFS